MMQSLYFAWSAFHPETEIITSRDVVTLLDGEKKSFVVVGYSTSYAWPDMLQQMLDEHAGGERTYHILNAVVGGAAVELWIGGQGQERKDRTIGAMVRDYVGDDARLRSDAPEPMIALCQQSLQFTRSQRGPIASADDEAGIRIGADAFEALAYSLYELGIDRVYIGTHIYKKPIEPEVGNERLALAELLRRRHPFIFAGPDVWTPTRDSFSRAFAEDGVHPSEHGMKMMAEGWYRAIAGPEVKQEIIDRMYAKQYDIDTMMRAYLDSRREE